MKEFFTKVCNVVENVFMTVIAEGAMWCAQDEDRMRAEHARIEAQYGP